jgi:hypothetical protein
LRQWTAPKRQNSAGIADEAVPEVQMPAGGTVGNCRNCREPIRPANRNRNHEIQSAGLDESFGLIPLLHKKD